MTSAPKTVMVPQYYWVTRNTDHAVADLDHDPVLVAVGHGCDARGIKRDRFGYRTWCSSFFSFRWVLGFKLYPLRCSIAASYREDDGSKLCVVT